MKDLVGLFSNVDLNFIHTSTGGIILGLAGTLLVAIVAYCIYRVAILGLKLATVAATVYFLVSFAQMPDTDLQAKQNTQNVVSKHSSAQGLRKEIKDLLESSKDNILPFVSGLI